MTRAEMAAKLREAALLVAAVEAGLNDRSTPCDHCGLSVKANWVEHGIRQQLGSAREKLLKCAGSLTAPKAEEHMRDDAERKPKPAFDPRTLCRVPVTMLLDDAPVTEACGAVLPCPTHRR